MRTSELLLLTLYRRGLILVVLLAVLPPVLLSSSYSLVTTVVSLRSEALVEYGGSGLSLLILGEPRPGNCTPIRYGYLALVVGSEYLQVPAVVVNNLESLGGVLRFTPVNPGASCVGLRASVGVDLLKVLASESSVDVVTHRGRAELCLGYTHRDYLRSVIVIEGLNTSTQLLEGFLCTALKRDLLKAILSSSMKELSSSLSLYSLAIVLLYLPILYLALRRIAWELLEELRVVRTQGVSLAELRIGFTLATALSTGIASTYSTVLSYLVVCVGTSILGYLEGSLLPIPQLTYEYFLPAALITSASIPVGYVALRLGEDSARSHS